MSLERKIRDLFSILLRLLLPPLEGQRQPPKDPKSILLMRVDRVGDLIVSTPAIRAIRMKFPRARIVVLASKLNREILRGNPDVDEVWTLSRTGLPALLWKLRAARWDLAVDLNAAPSLTSGLLARFSGAGVRVSFEKKNGEHYYDVRLPADEKAHRAREAMKVVSWLGGDDYDLQYRVYPGPQAERQAAEVFSALGGADGAKWVGVHPGNIKKYDNRWPEENFAALCDKIVEKGFRVLFLKGPDEDPLIESILGRMKAKPPVAPVLSLLPTACLLKKMSLVLCNSTSTLHLAAAAGVPTLSFLGGYSVACWKAMGDKHRVLEGSSWGSCRDISVEDAWRAFEEIL